MSVMSGDIMNLEEREKEAVESCFKTTSISWNDWGKPQPVSGSS